MPVKQGRIFFPDGKTKKRLTVMPMNKHIFFLIMMVFAAYAVFAQVSLESEIQDIERTVNRQGISAVERHDALVQLACLRQLSGDIEGAARNWLEAAAAIPGQVDDNALLACAYCLAAMGEWDRASKALEPLLSKMQRARFLDTGVKAIQSGNVSALVSLADSSADSQIKSEAYFLLWKLSNGQTAEQWRQKLLTEYPQSPEGRMAAGEAAVKTSPFWLFVGRMDSLALIESEAAVRTASSATVVPQSSSAVTPVPQPLPAAQVSGKLQTGIYSREENANAQVAGLRQAGFSPSIEKRGNEMWAVTVPSGPDQSRTIRELKAAGFDSFPLR
jgi:tetratricopeptide (TPR) repeat protein